MNDLTQLSQMVKNKLPVEVSEPKPRRGGKSPAILPMDDPQVCIFLGLSEEVPKGKKIPGWVIKRIAKMDKKSFAILTDLLTLHKEKFSKLYPWSATMAWIVQYLSDKPECPKFKYAVLMFRSASKSLTSGGGVVQFHRNMKIWQDRQDRQKR